MSYKVFFVEDEIITREGIRDNVDWQANGFEFCGEATDGETALALLRTVRPDVLITDIKMPFMDGLQLSRIVRERMPWVKIIILSGHDEFEYARKAISIGVTDYLLKPVTAQKLQSVLQNLSVQLDREKIEQERLKRLQEQVDENRETLREKLLFKLVMGAISHTEAIEHAQGIGLDLIARHYQVLILKIELADRTEQYDHDEYQQMQSAVAALAARNPDIFVLKRDWGDLILLFKGGTAEYLEEERDLLLDEIRQEVAKTRYQLTIGIGAPRERVADISGSYIDALVHLQNPSVPPAAACDEVTRAELLKVDRQAAENYLRHGVKDEFDAFFDAYLQPLSEAALKSNLIKNYIFMDMVLATARLVHELGGEIDKVIPELGAMENMLSKVKSVEELRSRTCQIVSTGLAYRDSQSASQYRKLIRRAKEYMEQHYADAELTLNEVAAHASLSPSHFSVVFSHETGQTFKEYLTERRINKAKELLRMTSLRSAAIAYQVGYHDPHYFSSVFKKNTGVSPLEFRAQT